MHMLPRRSLLLALLLTALPHALPAQAGPDRPRLIAQLDAWFKKAARAAPGQWGIAIGDSTGEVLWGVNERAPLTPASTVKLLTTGFARSMLGATARNPTRVLGEGSLDAASGSWLGSWVLEMNGDPFFERETAGATLDELAAQLHDRGIRQLTGPLVVRGGDGRPAEASFPSAWSARHWGRKFAPLIGEIVLNENQVWFAVGPGGKPGQRARVVGATPTGADAMVSVTATTTSGRGARLSLRPRSGGGWVLVGSIGVKSLPRRLTAMSNDPRGVLQAAWAAALRRNGVQWVPSDALGSAEGGSAKVLAEVTSAPLDSIAMEVNRRSLNIGAESMLRWAGGFQADRAAELLTAHVRTITGDEQVQLWDGSGLSADDRVTPRAFVSYLAKFPQTPAGRNFPQLLPANGSGTLRKMNRGFPAAGVVRAKTGTLANVATVVGYLGRQDGVLLVALMYNGPRPWAARQQHWKLFRLLGAHGAVIEADSAAVAEHLGGEGEGR